MRLFHTRTDRLAGAASMGLGIAAADRREFEAALGELSTAARAASGDHCGGSAPLEPGFAPPEVVRVVVDAPCFFRRYAPTKTTVTALSLAQRLCTYAFSLISPRFSTGSVVPEIVVCFDTQENMPPQRDAVAAKRNPRATPEELEKCRLDPTDARVIINGRIFAPEEVPLSDIELDMLDENTSFSFVRAMNSRAGKERLWRVLERAVIEVFAESVESRACVVTVDGPGVGPEAITILTRTGGDPAECVVTRRMGPRAVAFGEADQKVAYVGIRVPSPCPEAATVMVTVDTDLLAQMCILTPQRVPENSNLFILFLPHAASRGAGPRFVDCYGFPRDGSGSGIAFLLTLVGSDYTTSLVGCALSPVRALEGGLSGISECFSLVFGDDDRMETADGTAVGTGQIHTGGLLELVCRAHTQRNPRCVFGFDDRAGEFYISAAAASAAVPGSRPRKRPRTVADLHFQLKETAWLLAYWGFSGLDRTPAAPPALPDDAILFQTHSPIARFLKSASSFMVPEVIPI